MSFLLPAISQFVKALTQLGTMLLTPAYASPDQLLGQPVTTESDVYSLGLIAYEVFTGYRPYTFKSEANTGWEIMSVEIHRPSAVAHVSGDARELRGDLDTIIMKALKKEASERYSSAAAFADDLERYLRNDPVLAQPDSAGYRLRKFAVRHRLVVGAAAAVVVALASGLTVATWQLQIAREEKRHAEEVKDFVASIFRSADPFFTGSHQMSAAQLLTLAKDRIDREMASQPHDAAELLLIVGEAQANLEQLDEAKATLERALANAKGVLPDDSLQVAAGRAQLASIAMQQAINAPRISSRNGPLSLEVLYPNRRHLRDELEKLGWQVKEERVGYDVWGGAHGIRIRADGTLEGGADPRREGAVRGY